MTGLLEPGTYRLTRDLPAIERDRRKRHDWRAAPLKAGTLFSVGVMLHHFDKPDWAREIWPSGGYQHHRVMQCNGQTVAVAALVDALVRVEETPSMWLAREHGGLSVARGILDELVSSGAVTLEQVKAACERYLDR